MAAARSTSRCWRRTGRRCASWCAATRTGRRSSCGRSATSRSRRRTTRPTISSQSISFSFFVSFWFLSVSSLGFFFFSFFFLDFLNGRVGVSLSGGIFSLELVFEFLFFFLGELMEMIFASCFSKNFRHHLRNDFGPFFEWFSRSSLLQQPKKDRKRTTK